LYGLRTISPIAVGTSDIPTAKFVLLNGIAAAFWACLFTGIGFGLGDRIKHLSRHGPSAGTLIIAVLAVITILAVGGRIAWRVYHRSGKRQ
jgi:membrane protein DedA with SNARE-associated domain